ncbi:MAG: tryptophan synthase subunit alpha, partial [Amylibacter sp.]
DGAVVGSAIVSKLGAGDSVEDILAFIADLAAGAHRA